jgi:hypothetical protein
MESSGVAGGVTDGENYLKRCSPVLKGYREDGRSAIATSLMNVALVIARSASDEAIQSPARGTGLLRFARNDGKKRPAGENSGGSLSSRDA